MYRNSGEVAILFGGNLSPEDEKLKELAMDLAVTLQMAGNSESRGFRRSKTWVDRMTHFIETRDRDPYFRGIPELIGLPKNHNISALTPTELVELKAYAGDLLTGVSIRTIAKWIDDPEKVKYLLSHFKLAMMSVKR